MLLNFSKSTCAAEGFFSGDCAMQQQRRSYKTCPFLEYMTRTSELIMQSKVITGLNLVIPMTIRLMNEVTAATTLNSANFSAVRSNGALCTSSSTDAAIFLNGCAVHIHNT